MKIKPSTSNPLYLWTYDDESASTSTYRPLSATFAAAGVPVLAEYDEHRLTAHDMTDFNFSYRQR